MTYTVPGIKLIPQDKDSACWYASAKMLITWRRGATRMTERDLRSPAEDSESIRLYKKNDGIGDAQIIDLAKRLGLRAIPPMSPSEVGLEKWLKSYGPLWVNGKSHIVVIAGIKPGHVFVYDPWPPNKGTIEWRSLAGWYIGKQADARDTTTTSGVFLYCPPL